MLVICGQLPWKRGLPEIAVRNFNFSAMKSANTKYCYVLAAVGGIRWIWYITRRNNQNDVEGLTKVEEFVAEL